jgi:hypothetical protein
MKIEANPTFVHNVTVLTPSNGGFDKENLKVTFRFFDLDAVNKYDLATTEGSTEFFKAVIADLGDLTDSAGQPVAYSETVRDALLRRHSVRQALSSHYFDAITKVKTGN